MARTAVILAGGRSQRFGQDKAWACFQEKPLIQILIDTLKASQCDIVLSGPKQSLSPLNFPIIEDEVVFEGPLKALETILSQTEAEKILLTACDMPFLKKEVIDVLWEESQSHDIVILSNQNFPSPVPGVYDSKILPLIQKLLEKGRRDLKSLLQEDLKIKTLSPEFYEKHDPDYQSLWNVNTSKDLQEYRDLKLKHDLDQS